MNAVTNRLVALATATLMAMPALPALAQEPTESATIVEGLWCGAGLLRGATLELSQDLMRFNGTLRYRDRARTVRGDIEGTTLRTFTEKAGALVLELQGARLRIQEAGGNLALARGQSFVRANGGGCA